MVDLIGVVGAIVVGVIGLLSVLVFARERGTQVQTTFAFLVQIFLGVGQYLYWGLRDDQLTYFDLASKLAVSLQTDPALASAGIAGGKQSFVWILAGLFLLWGTSPLPGLVLNAVFVSALPTISVAIGRNFRLFTNGKITGWVAALAPPILLWGPGLKREPLVFMLLTLLLLGLSWAFQGRYALAFLIISLGSAAIAVTRLSVIGAAMIIALLAASIPFLSRLQLATSVRRGVISGYTARVSAALAIAICLAALPLAFQIPQFRLVHGGSAELTEGQSTAVPNSSWEVEDSLLGLLEYFARALFNLLQSVVGPFPWEVTNLPLFVFFLDGSIYGVLVICLVALYISRTDRASRTVITMLALATSPIVIANFVYLANYGLTSRVRAHVFVMLLAVFEPVLVEIVAPWWRRIIRSSRYIFTAAEVAPAHSERSLESGSLVVPIGNRSL